MITTPTGCRIRLLCVADIPFAMSLKNEAGWNQVERDWQNYLTFEPRGCFLAELHGSPAGTAITIRYDNRIGWIGMVLVHPEFRSRGIATCLVHHCIQHLKRRGTETIKLDATSAGKKVYARLGFQDEYEVYRMQGQAKASSPFAFPTADRGTIDEIAAYDTPIFGASRARVIHKLAQDSPTLSLVARADHGCVTGYIFARPGYEAYQIGPWVADSHVIAEHLFVAMLTRLSGERVFLDVPLSNPSALPIVEKHSFLIQRTFTRMFLGSNRYKGMPEKVYATSSAEKG